jgi:hypothetical protein
VIYGGSRVKHGMTDCMGITMRYYTSETRWVSVWLSVEVRES